MQETCTITFSTLYICVWSFERKNYSVLERSTNKTLMKNNEYKKIVASIPELYTFAFEA